MKVLDHTDNPLSQVLAEALSEPPELPRLTVAQTFVHFQRMHTALENAMHECSQVPAATQADCSQHLKDLIRYCETAIKTANRMLEANR